MTQIYYYVYRVTCHHTTMKNGPKYYYGSRGSIVPPNQDINYWSSSKIVKKYIHILGLKYFTKKIIACFETREQAISQEIKLHRFFDVKNHPLFFNVSNQTSSGFVTALKLTDKQKQKLREKALGKIHSIESRKKMSLQRRGKKRKPLSLEHREKIRIALLGKSHSLATREKMSQTRKKLAPGKHTDATKQKISQKLKQVFALRHVENQVYTCPHCGKAGKVPGIFVWHFQNCKLNPEKK